MREEYIQQIKNYLSKNPGYKESLNDLKTQALTIGATEEEFNEALHQVGIHQQVSNSLTGQSKFNQNEKSNDKKLTFSPLMIELDIVTHVVLLGILLAIGLIFLVENVVSGNKKDQAATTQNIASQTSNMDRNPARFLTQQVFASTIPVDAQKVFSFPPSQVTLTVTGTPKKAVFGFFPYWMLDEEELVSLNAVTTVALFGLDVDGGGNIITKQSDGQYNPGWAMWNNAKLNTFITRAKRRGVKAQLVMKAFDNKNIDTLVASDQAQKTFISNALFLLNAKQLDGINLDFEYSGDTPSQTRNGFTRLVTNLSTELKRQYPNSFLSIDTYVTSASVPRLFDLAALEPYVDSFVIMGYDIHTPKGDPGPVAPMEGVLGLVGFMQSYLEKTQPDKLILAVPYYGYDWNTTYTTDVGQIVPYAQIVDQSKTQTIKWDDISQTPWYQYKDPQANTQHQVYFENPRSLAIKYDYVNSKNLKGIGIWALGYDGLNADLRTLIIEKFGQ